MVSQIVRAGKATMADWLIMFRPVETFEFAVPSPDMVNEIDVYGPEDLELGETGEETGGMRPGPAILWGILISDSENGLLEAPIIAIAAQKGSEPAYPNDAVCPAILSGILSSELSTKAMTNGFSNLPESRALDVITIINLWIDAGYECQLPVEKNAFGRTVTDSKPIQYTPPETRGPFIVQDSPGKGQGVFAAREVDKGERILVDKPFFVVSKPYTPQKVLNEFERMPLARRQQYMQLYCPDRLDDIHLTDVMCIFEANCFNIGESAAMFLTATRFNHSCLPNTYYSWSEKRGEIVFHAMIDTPEGEELTICYGRPFLTRLERQSQLRIYNFSCCCSACQTETAFSRASESRRLDMRALNEQIIMFQSRLNEALMLYGLQDPLTAILRLIAIIKEEGLHGELMTPYRDAAECLKGRGNFQEAFEFAQVELEEEVVCLGNDSEVVQKTIEYIEELETMLRKAKAKDLEVQEYEDDAENFEWGVESASGKDSDAEAQEPEQDLGEKKFKKPDSDKHAPEKQVESESKRTEVAVIGLEKDLPAQTVEEVHEDPSSHANDSEAAQMDSRSSSPRLVRKK